MKYASLIEIIKTAAETALAYGLPEDATPGTFIYASKGEASLKHDLPFPHIILAEPLYRENDSNPAIRTYNCIIGAMGRDTDLNDSATRHSIESEMDVLMSRFKTILDDQNDTIQISFTQNKIERLNFAARSTGVTTQLTITGAFIYENCEPVAD